MRKVSILIFFLLSVAMALTFVSCRTHTQMAKSQTDLRLKVDSAATSVQKSIVKNQSDSTSIQKNDSAVVHVIKDNTSERLISESFTPFLLPNGTVIPVINRRDTKIIDRQTLDSTSTYVSQISFWKKSFDSLRIKNDSLATQLKLAKNLKSNEKSIEKDEPPNYAVLIISLLAVFISLYFVKNRR